jgi:integrase
MPIEKLTPTLVRLAYCQEGKKRTDYFDSAISGYVLEVHPNGKKTFSLRYRDGHGRQKQKAIGCASVLSADQARKAATKLKARIAMGEDPVEQKKQKRSILTIDQLSKRYLEHVRGYKRSPDIDQRYLKHHILPRFGRMRLDEVKQAEVANWLSDKGKVEGYAPATVNRFQVIMSYMYKLAKRWGLPGADINPLFGLKLLDPNNNRERFLTAEETQRLRRACSESDNPQLKDIVALLILTGCRKRELLDAKWEHFDLEKRQWRIPMSKTGKARFVPLPDAALAVLSSLKRWDRCPYVVPNPKTKLPYHSVYNSWDRARRAAGVPDVRMHDLRHSAASNMVNAGQSLYVVGQVLGHAQVRTTQRYAHLSQDTLLAAVNAAAEVMATDWVSA